jgi:Dolichyl-phosphate-mannose-protein mannosyltransferase
MSSPAGSVRKRKDANIPAKAKDASATSIAAPRDAELDALVKANLQKTGVEWDYRIALSIITLLAFITRFWGISHPNEVVFDEVHFGKVHYTIGQPLGETSPLTFLYSLPHITSSERTSSMSIRPLESFSLPLWDGS